jgi:precorrin-2 dehydrogenase / sirohydrochlorin ferrochelatase
VADGRRGGALVLAVDDPANCDLIAPAVIRRGDLVVAISTNGRSPAMARFARENLSADVPDDWAQLLDVAATVRERLRTARCAVSAERWQAALRAPELNRHIQAGAPEVAADCLFRLLTPDTA